MKREIISMALSAINQEYIEQSAIFMPEKVKGKKIRRRRGLVIRIAAALILAMSATAAASEYFSLRDMEIEHPEGWGPTAVTTAGYNNSPLFQAAAEWDRYLEFCPWGENEQDAEEQSEEYKNYREVMAYSQKARERFDEILEKYNLRFPEYKTVIDNGLTGLCSHFGISEFIPNCEEKGYAPVYAVYYEGGTLNLCDVSQTAEGEFFCYELNRYVDGYNVRPIEYVFDIESATEWDYVCEEGTSVHIALGPERTLITAGFENSFLCIFIRSGSENTEKTENEYGTPDLTQEKLEAFVEEIDFILIDSIK